MTGSGSVGTPFLRTLLAVVVIADLLSFFFILDEARSIGEANGALNSFNDPLSTAAVRGIIVLIGVVGAIGFARKPGRLREGALALGALALLSTAHAQLFGSPWRHLYYSGLCLSGWLLGLWVGRRRGVPAAAESFARMGSIALLASAYLNAGISKTVYGGLDWLSGLPIQAAIVAQDGLVPDGVVSAYRSWVVATPAVASLLAILTEGFELAAPLMIAGRRTRAFVALGLFAFHANIYLLTPILYWEAMVLLLAFGLSPDAPEAAPAPDSAGAIPSSGRAFSVGAALLALCAVIAIGNQARRYARLETARMLGGPPVPNAPAAPSVPPIPPEPSAPTVSPIASAPPTPNVLPATPVAAAPRQVGPFAVGQSLATGWAIDSLEISEGGFITTLSGKRGRAAFEVTCRASDLRSPFDLEEAHIFYSSEVEFRDLEDAGWAVRQHVQDASAGKDICEQVASWRTSRQAEPPPRGLPTGSGP